MLGSEFKSDTRQCGLVNVTPQSSLGFSAPVIKLTQASPGRCYQMFWFSILAVCLMQGAHCRPPHLLAGPPGLPHRSPRQAAGFGLPELRAEPSTDAKSTHPYPSPSHFTNVTHFKLF